MTARHGVRVASRALFMRCRSGNGGCFGKKSTYSLTQSTNYSCPRTLWFEQAARRVRLLPILCVTDPFSIAGVGTDVRHVHAPSTLPMSSNVGLRRRRCGSRVLRIPTSFTSAA